MAWGGKTQTRMNDKQRKHFFATSNRRVPDPPDPEKEVLKQLAREQLPPTKEAYQARYNELMQAALKQKEWASWNQVTESTDIPIQAVYGRSRSRSGAAKSPESGTVRSSRWTRARQKVRATHRSSAIRTTCRTRATTTTCRKTAGCAAAAKAARENLISTGAAGDERRSLQGPARADAKPAPSFTAAG